MDAIADTAEFGKEFTRESLALATELAKAVPYLNGGIPIPFPIPFPVRSKNESTNRSPTGGSQLPQPQNPQGMIPISSVLLSGVVEGTPCCLL